MISDKKKIWVIFLSKFNMGCKAAEATCNINSAFGRGTANECTVQWWVKKFCKGDESLEDEQCSGQAWEVDSDQFGTIIKSDPLTTADVAEELSQWLKSLSRVTLCDPMNRAARQASLSITNSRSLPKPMPIESVMPSSHLILGRPLLLLPPIAPSIRVFSSESPKNSTSTILWLFGIYSKVEVWKSLISVCLMSCERVSLSVLSNSLQPHGL